MTPHPQPEWIIKEDELQKVCEVLRDEGCGQYAKILSQTIHSRPYPSIASGQCSHWKCTDHLKSDFRDQNLPRYYCDKQFGREQVLDYLDEWVNSGENLTLFKWELREELRKLRQQGEQEIRYSAIIHHNFPEYKAPVKVIVFHDDSCQSDVMYLAINDRVVGALSKELRSSKQEEQG